MIRLFLLFAIYNIDSGEVERSNPRDTFKRNAWLYEAYMDVRFPLYEMGRLHLLCLRQMISKRLGDHNMSYKDSQEIYELSYGKRYLTEELIEKYQ